MVLSQLEYAARKRGRVVDCTGLENRRRETFREFESHRFRQNPTPSIEPAWGFLLPAGNLVADYCTTGVTLVSLMVNAATPKYRFASTTNRSKAFWVLPLLSLAVTLR